MMAISGLRSEERIGLAVALALHAALVAALLLQPGHHAAFPLPERMVVSLSREVALESTAPHPSQDNQAAIAPTLSEEPAPAPEPESRPVVKQAPPRPVAKPHLAPVPDPISRQIERVPSRQAPPKTSRQADKKGGGARIGNDFLKGAASGERSEDAALPASAIGAAEKASLIQAIAREIKPFWSAPQGVDTDLLVTILAFDLNPDGSLNGPPRLVAQSGDTAANRAQAGRHAELAMRAVVKAAPFDLPPKYYNVWKRVSSFRFDRKLSQ